MKTYQFVDQAGDHTVTEQEIIDQYFEYWSGRMEQAGKIDMISHARCIEDFCVVHWATEVQ